MQCCLFTYVYTVRERERGGEREREAHMLVCTVCEDVHEKKYPAANE